MSSSSSSSSSGDAAAATAHKRKHEETIIDAAQVAASVAARQSKKRYKDLPPTDVRCTIAPSGNLATMVYTLEAILTEVNLQFCKTPSFSGIRVDETSPDLTCMIKAKLACNVELKGGTERVSCGVNIKEMKPIMKAAQGETAIDIAQYTGNDHLTLECVNHIPLREFSLRTIVMDDHDERLFNISTQFTISMSCAVLKDFARRACVDFHCEHIKISVSSFKTQDVVHAFFELSCFSDGIPKAKLTYHSENSAVDTGDSMEIACTSAITSLDVLGMSKKATVDYRANFSSEYITNFLKSFDRGDVFLSLNMTEQGPGPLILHTTLGSDNSYMRLVLAPKVGDDE